MTIDERTSGPAQRTAPRRPVPILERKGWIDLTESGPKPKWINSWTNNARPEPRSSFCVWG